MVLYHSVILLRRSELSKQLQQLKKVTIQPERFVKYQLWLANEFEMKIDNNWLALTSKRFHPTKLAEQVQVIEARTNVRVTATTQKKQSSSSNVLIRNCKR